MQFFEDCEKISKTSFVHSQSQYYSEDPPMCCMWLLSTTNMIHLRSTPGLHVLWFLFPTDWTYDHTLLLVLSLATDLIRKSGSRILSYRITSKNRMHTSSSTSYANSVVNTVLIMISALPPMTVTLPAREVIHGSLSEKREKLVYELEEPRYYFKLPTEVVMFITGGWCMLHF